MSLEKDKALPISKIDNKDSEYRGFLCIGVIKLDYKVAGYPDLVRFAKKWVGEASFVQLIVRKVSSSNFGYQFVYLDNESKSSKEGERKWKEVYDLVVKEFGSVYANDYEYTSLDNEHKLEDYFIVNKAIEI